MVARAGHSLVELMVAMVVLGVALSGVAATSTLSLRLTRDAIRFENDAARAAAILDSLAVHDAPSSGVSTVERTTFEWVVTAMANGRAHLSVTATDGVTGAEIVRLSGAWAPTPPATPSP